MRKVKLRMKEQMKYETIKELVDHGGNKKRAALKLDLSVRQINRLILKYKEKGKDAFVHGNRSHKPVNSLPQDLTDKIISLYRTRYQGFNFNHYKDLLKRKEGIIISYNALYLMLMKEGIVSPKAQKKTKRRIAKQEYLKAHPKEKAEDSEIELKISHEIELSDSHPRQSRCKLFGEEIQMDGSIHNWFGENKTCLHLAIDNCTGMIVAGYFDKQETLHGYYQLLHHVLKHYGIPYRFKTDNRTVFAYNSLTHKTDEKDTLTQFGYACNHLGIEIVTTSVSQAKGMIERANGTFQSRLVNELSLYDIKDIENANRYLIEEFIPSYNERFANNPSKFKSVFEVSPSDEEINLTLSVRSSRKVDSGNSIKYFNKYYQPYDSLGNLKCFKTGTKCLVTRTLDNNLYVTIDDGIYLLKEVIKNKEISVDFDVDIKQEKNKVYIPPMSHPWKHASFVSYQQKAHKYKDYN